MKTQGIKKVTLLVIAVLMMAGSNLYAQRGRNYSNQEKGFKQNQICTNLDLTEDQQNKIEAFRINHLKEMTSFKNQLNELDAKKQTLMTSDNSDINDVNSIIDQMTEIHNKMMKSSAKHQQDIRNVLTDEQKVYFDGRPMNGHRHGRGVGRHEGYSRGNRHGDGYGRGNGMSLYPNCLYNTVNE